MIRFTCLCQNRIEVPEDMAGGLTQCARCGRLNDVPTLSDLPYLADDGTYVVDVPRPKDDPIRLAELAIVYSKGTTDADGDEIDLRMTAAELAVGPDGAAGEDVAAGDEDGVIPLKDDPAPRPVRSVTAARASGEPRSRPAPRYDPETGELITPVELKEDEDAPVNPASIPMARAAIGYASGETARRVTAAHAAVELLMPVNVTVMTFIFIAHVLLQFTGTVAVNRLYLFAVIPLLIAGMIISHYGNVIDDVGPGERDELPRPLRQCELYDDVWLPLVNVLCGLAICFFVPVMVLLKLRPVLPPAINLALFGLLMLVGVFALPAVLLTTTTSGTIINLRPDRFLGLIRTCGGGYGLAVLLGALATGAYGFGVVSADLAFIRVLTGAASPLPPWVHVVGYPMLALGIYFAHLFCWHLGLLYRAHHPQFSWAYQRHERDPMKAVAAARHGSVRDAAASAGRTGAAHDSPRRKDTKTKLRELREAERKRRQEQTLTDRELKKPTTKYLGL